MVVESKRKPLNRAARNQMKLIARRGCGHERLKRQAAMYKRLCGQQEEEIRKLTRTIVDRWTKVTA